ESSGGAAEEEDDTSSEEGPPCDIGLLERLIRTHPVWFLPGIQRAGAFHLLQGKEEGNFVVRQSSQTSTMAISVRLPTGKGPYIEHYLIQAGSDGKLSLESSDNKFHSIPILIAHYAQCCDELPVQLSLPRTIREARTRQQLSSLALLGQEFWRYPMANPRPTKATPETNQQHSEGLNSSLPSSQASSLSSFGSGNNNAARSPSGEPSDSIVLNLAPLNDQSQPHSLMSTFKGSPPNTEAIGSPTSLPCDSPTSPPSNVTNPLPRAPRPTPPNTLNLVCSATTTNSGSKSASNTPATTHSVFPTKTPPPPPPRWSKPPAQNLTVTTVTVSMTETITASAQIDTISKLPSLGDTDSLPSLPSGTATLESIKANILSPSQILSPTQVLSPAGSEARNILSPVSDSKPPHRRSKRHKESRHYQESDILESPTVYCRSSVADKVSDYEDIWGTESLSTFKPRSSPFISPDDGKRVPDILDRVITATPVTTPSPAPRPSLQKTSFSNQVSPTEPKTPTEQAPTTNNKQSSPFYCEPADAIRSAALEVARRRHRGLHNNNRHSDPPALAQWPASAAPGGLERIDSKEELNTTGLSSSVDNLAGLRRGGRRLGERGKAKPRIVKRPQAKGYGDASWTVDSSWEFIGNEDEASSDHDDIPEENFNTERRFPSLEQQDSDSSPGYKGVTVQEIIAERFPELRLPTDLSVVRGEVAKSDSSGNSGSRVSAYDNVTNNRANGASTQSHASDNDDTQTVFSEPWDSSRWENLLERENNWQRGDERTSIVRTKSFKERLDPLLCK
ncbi:hypothetical protein AAG570_008557, partial [Ranatra chinensis]